MINIIQTYDCNTIKKETEDNDDEKKIGIKNINDSSIINKGKEIFFMIFYLTIQEKNPSDFCLFKR